LDGTEKENVADLADVEKSVSSPSRRRRRAAHSARRRNTFVAGAAFRKGACIVTSAEAITCFALMW
jgi:hypothetical protein